MDWPTAAIIISIALGVIGAVVTIWSSAKARNQVVHENEAYNMLAHRIQRIEDQIDLLLKELMELMKE